MTASSELRRARRSAARGRIDEALVYLWNALEPARLEGETAVTELRRVAALISSMGDNGQRREAERLVEAIDRSSDTAPVAVAVREHGDHDAFEDARPDVEREAAEPVSGRPRRGGLLLPIIFLLIILINVIVRAVSGE